MVQISIGLETIILGLGFKMEETNSRIAKILFKTMHQANLVLELWMDYRQIQIPHLIKEKS